MEKYSLVDETRDIEAKCMLVFKHLHVCLQIMYGCSQPTLISFQNDRRINFVLPGVLLQSFCFHLFVLCM